MDRVYNAIMKKYCTLFAGVAIIVLLLAQSPLTAKAVSDTNLYLSPSIITSSNDITVLAMINPGSNQVRVVDLVVVFDPTRLQFNSATNAESPFSNVLVAAATHIIDNTHHSITFSVGVPVSHGTPVTTTSLVGTFSFSPLSLKANTTLAISHAASAYAVGEDEDVVTTRTGAVVKFGESDSSSGNIVLVPTNITTTESSSSKAISTPLIVKPVDPVVTAATSSKPFPAGCFLGFYFSTTTGKKCPVEAGKSSSIPSVSSSTSTVVLTTTFTRNLRVGLKGDDVRLLQVYLNNHGFPVVASGEGSVGHESTYFGILTQSALVRFQVAKGIFPAAGYFGPFTKTYIQVHP